VEWGDVLVAFGDEVERGFQRHLRSRVFFFGFWCVLLSVGDCGRIGGEEEEEEEEGGFKFEGAGEWMLERVTEAQLGNLNQICTCNIHGQSLCYAVLLRQG
jgi:hypothetical protein